MAGTPNRTLREYFTGEIDLENDTLKVALYDDSAAYTFDEDAHEFVGDVLDGGTTAQELGGSSGYTGSGDRATVENASVTQDNTGDRGVFDADDVSWSGVESTEDIQGWIVFKEVTDDTDSPVLIVVDDDMSDAPDDLPLVTNGSDITIEWDDVGIQTLEVAD